MDSRQLRYFASIHEEGSLARAAERERVAVSALSRHVANLEADLGSTLFEREPRGMRPTAAGIRLYEHARTILRAMDAAEADLRNEGREVAGEVSIGMAYSAVKAIGVTLMQRVLADYPKLKLSLSESLSGSTLLHLLASEVDLALVYNPPPDPRLRIQPVLEEQMVLLGRADLIGGADPITFDEMLELPLIILRQGLSARALMDDATLLKRLEERAQLQMNSVSAISGSLLSGIGCAIGTNLFMQEHLKSGELVARPIISPKLSRTLYMCEMTDRPATFALETIRQLCVNLSFEAVTSGRWEARAAQG
jgi:LysR family transcriptional regulator, nitrogen assimilation regulatory protein